MRIADYDILGPLGQGGAGTLYRARRGADGMLVALKVVDSNADAEARERFRREIRAARTLEHPGLVELFEGGEDGDRLYYAMELVEGRSLWQVVTPGRAMPTGTVARIARELGEVLAYLHSRGFIHRDLTPANVLLARARGAASSTGDAADGRGGEPGLAFTAAEDRRLPEVDGRVVLIDLGLVRGEAWTPITVPDQRLGTLGYMSPEALCGEPVGPWSDIYQLGALIYEASGGSATWSVADLMQFLDGKGPRRSLPLDLPGSHPGLLSLALRCLSVERGPRPSGARQFLAALDAVEGLGEPAGAGPQ